MIARALAENGSVVEEFPLTALAWDAIRSGTPFPAPPGAAAVAYVEDLPVPAPAPTFWLSDAEIARLDAEAGWHPSPDQAEAIATLRAALPAPGEYALTGAAGTGKTACLLALLRALSPCVQVILIAPTWRAANRVAEVTGRYASSLHAAVYGRPVEERQCPCGQWSRALMDPQEMEVDVAEEGVAVRVKLPRYVCPACAAAHEDATRFDQRLVFQLKFAGSEEAPPTYRLVVTDESSMVHPRDAEAARIALGGDAPTSFLWVGDPNQLPWVQESDADVDASKAPDLLRPTATLRTIHRQAAGSPILALAHTLLTVPEVSTTAWPWPHRLAGIRVQRQVGLEVPAQWAADLRCRGEDVAVICLSNRTRAALNFLVRSWSGATRVAGGALIPGDRLLARANSPIPLRREEATPSVDAPVVHNGEIWTVLDVRRVPAGTRLLNDHGRATRARAAYEHDRVLEDGAAVWAIRAVRLGCSDAADLFLVTARDGDDRMLLESGMIRAGMPAAKARQRARDTARAWCEEYAAAVREKQREYEYRANKARDWRIGHAQWLAHGGGRNRRIAHAALRKLSEGAEVDQAALVDLRARYDGGEFAGAGPDALAAAVACLPSRWDAVLSCANAADYCRVVYDAIDVARVAVFDEGEALTCHAMQGAQARHVGIVADSALYGMWRNERVDGLRWCYTAVTRCEADLALFSVKKQEGG